MNIITIDTSSIGKDFFRSAKYHNVQCPMHIHDILELVFVYSGKLIMNINGQDRVITAGQATLMMPFDRHSFFTPNESNCLVVEFSPHLVNEFYEKIKNKIPSQKVFDFDRKIIDFCENNMTMNASDKLSNKAMLYTLCNEVIKSCSFESGNGKIDDVFIEAIKYIFGNFKKWNLSLVEVAKEIGVHHVYLSRVFARNAGMNFRNYLAILRCNCAAGILKSNRNKTVSEIALDSGFGSIRSFNRHFLKVFGVTPIEYRESGNNDSDDFFSNILIQ